MLYEVITVHFTGELALLDFHLEQSATAAANHVLSAIDRADQGLGLFSALGACDIVVTRCHAVISSIGFLSSLIRM